MKKLMVLASLVLATVAGADCPKQLTTAQCENLALVWRVGQAHSLGWLMQAQALQESSARNGVVGDEGESLGLLQIQPATAMRVLDRNPTLWVFKLKRTEANVAVKLLTDKQFNAMVALTIHVERKALPWCEMVALYNVSEKGLKKFLTNKKKPGRTPCDFPYVKKVKERMLWLETHGAKGGALLKKTKAKTKTVKKP